MAIQHQGGGQSVTGDSFLLGFSLGSDAMTQEESFRCGNHRSAKKHKQNKIPQRGLGVAQLEKIRLEEQQESFPISHSFPAINLHPPPNSSSVSYKHSQDPVFAIPDLHPLSLSKTPAPFANSPVLPLSWSHHEPFFTNADNFGLPFPALYDPNAYRKQLNLVSVSPPSSRGVDLQMEPPSNQIYNHTKSKWKDEEERVVSIKRPRSFLDDSPSNSSRENQNHHEYSNPIFRDEGLQTNSKQRSWKSIRETDFRAKDNGGLGAFLTLGLTFSSSSISRSIKSSVPTTECDCGHRCQERPAKRDSLLPRDSIGGSTNRESVSNSRFGSDEELSLSADPHRQLSSLRHHLYPHLRRQASCQFYSLLYPEPNHEKSEHEDRRDSVQTETKTCIDLSLKL